MHTSCRINFRTRYSRYFSKFNHIQTPGTQQCQETPNETLLDDTTAKPSNTRSKVGLATIKSICFVCNKSFGYDINPYNQGGLGRCSQESSAKKLDDGVIYHINEASSEYRDAALRLKVMRCGTSHDVFALDVYYHQSCYLKFTRTKKKVYEKDEVKQMIEKQFVINIKLNIIRDNNGYLLNEILNDIKNLCSENNIEPFITTTRSLRRYLETTFHDDIGFFNKGRHVIVYSTDTNPCQYSVSTLQGTGLRDADLIKAFTNMVHRKIENEKKEQAWPVTPEQLTEMLEKGPLSILYNVIYLSMYQRCKYNEYGYAITDSPNISNKIWSIASDWSSLITGLRSPKQIIVGTNIHRLTASKEVVSILHKAGHSISYNDIRLLNDCWSKLGSTKEVYNGLLKGHVTHSSLDNNDGRQETMTGQGTTHHTNSLIFQPLIKGKCCIFYSIT